MFAHQHPACNRREGLDFESMGAEEIQGLIKIRIAGFSSHVRFPVCEDVEIEVGVNSAEQQRRILNLAYLERRLQFLMKTGNALPASGGSLGSSLAERIGSTPLIRLEGLVRHFPGITLLAKAEWANPGGSVKDRAAASIVQDARTRGLLPVGKTLLDASSGNTGIAFAMLGAALGFPVHLAMPTNVSPERKRILRAYGAHMDWTDPDQGSDGAIRRARELAGNDPDRFFYADQYSNDANWLAHYRTTGAEIWEQTAGRVTHFVAGLGTSGTFMGTTRRLKEFNPAIQAISFQPDSPFHGLEGLKYMGSSIVPAIYNPHLADRELEIDTEASYDMAKRLARDEGILVGISAAAAVVACLKIAEEEGAAGREAVIVTVLPDSADKYLSERFWEEDGWAYSI
jgi:cysteine synthase B